MSRVYLHCLFMCCNLCCLTTWIISSKTFSPYIHDYNVAIHSNNSTNITTTATAPPTPSIRFPSNLSCAALKKNWETGLWKNDDLVVLLTWTQIEGIIWNMLYNLEVIYHSLLWACVCVCARMCYNETSWHIWDAFCITIYMMTNYV